MAKVAQVSAKHIQLDKNQSTILAVIALTVALVIFGLFAIKAEVTKGMYQRRVINARRAVADRLKDNYTAAQTLVTQYNVFAQQDPNILGGSAASTATSLDGDNSWLVLDSLPSTYDAPALATSVEKVMLGRNVTINSLTVTDDPSANSDKPEQQPQAKPITFSFEATTNYASAVKLLQDFERSIRPFDLNTMEIAGTDTSLHLTVGMTTYYQPAKSLDLTPSKEVK